MQTEDYLNFNRYQNQPAAVESGFSSFYDEDANKYYFSVLDDDNTTVLFISEGYTSEAGRDNGIASVVTNRDLDERYMVKSTEEGRYYLSLRAANNQEIARSNYFRTQAEAIALLPSERKKVKLAAMAAVANTNANDNYLDCIAYENKPLSSFEGFSAFQHETNGQHYFAMIDKTGKVLLRSEGYTTTQSRDNGIQSVIKNRELPERYSVRDFTSGKRIVFLLAANHKEIARSCPISDEKALFALFPLLAPVALGAVGGKDDDYLGCHEYTGYEPDANGIARFEKNGQYYFVWYDENGKVLLRSEGFETQSALQEELDLVLKHRHSDSRYEAIEKAGYRIRVLKDEKGREIGRSCAEKFVVAPPPVVASPPPVAAALPAEPVAASGGFNWWWLIIPLLLLLLFFWWRSCNKTPEVVPPPPPVEAPVDTTKRDTIAEVAPKTAEAEVRIKSIFFDFNSTSLRAESVAELDILVSVLKNNPDYTTVLNAYADSKGSDVYNEALSRKRANAAKDYLVSKGIDAKRIAVSVFGKKDPIAKNQLADGTDSEAGRQFNRRIEIEVKNNAQEVEIVEKIQVPEDLKE
ncbi:DUF1508 domain-containing protein [Solitalea sp. MAHUQ-68]|uniref:DUF1508 domain-containing protein n=1 Tax=Solitalea agri TaxID=2953739 RepID=A0A9X2F813_9SPHI|nr:DUF1508 domain-containing protein [Solitalea agri]MCO4294046.1 DUF1508 domain-containing protein [Solitalea agri]